MYLGRALSFFGLEFIALAVGMVKGALDEYLELITTRTTHRPPIVLRAHDPDYQRWYGHARAKVDTAEAAMFSAADQWMQACRRQVEDGVPFDVEEDLRHPVDHARVGAPVLGRAAGVRRSARRARAPPTTASGCSASGATCRWSGAISPASSATGPPAA